MENNSKSGSMGVGFILFVVFLVLKLTGTISWSWWWVTAPLWGGVALAIIFVLVGIVLLVIAEKRKAKNIKNLSHRQFIVEGKLSRWAREQNERYQ